MIDNARVRSEARAREIRAREIAAAIDGNLCNLEWDAPSALALFLARLEERINELYAPAERGSRVGLCRAAKTTPGGPRGIECYRPSGHAGDHESRENGTIYVWPNTAEQALAQERRVSFSPTEIADELRRRFTDLERERDALRLEVQRIEAMRLDFRAEAQHFQSRCAAVERERDALRAERDRMAALLRRLDSRGGLGIDVHERIRELLGGGA